MKYAIIYSSRTGNTAKLAAFLYQTLGEAACQYYGIDKNVDLKEAEVIFVGFWTDKGSCDPETKMLLRRLAHKQVFLFGTAGFGGSAAYFEQILNAVAALLPGTTQLLGAFLCQGRLQDAVKARYEAILQKNPEDLAAQNALLNFAQALSHPDAEDFAALRLKVQACLC